MDLTTRSGRMQYALGLLAELKSPRRAPGDIAPNSESPPGDCGRPIDDPRGCGMKDESECRTHADVSADDPAILSIAGTRRQAREQLRAARRQGLRF
jgi:hypothetical protein